MRKAATHTATSARPNRKPMERLLHYAWQNRLFPLGELHTTDGKRLEIINTGLHNCDSGPDFINSVIRIDGVEFAGNVEIHTKSSDWNRHGHTGDPKYGNVILHVVSQADAEVKDFRGRRLLQFVMQVPQYVEENYTQLLIEEKYPPCHRLAAVLDPIKTRAWLSVLHIERLEEKTNRVFEYLNHCKGDWNRVCFITVARNFGFGINGEAFENWACNVPLLAAAKHRDNIFQLEALFLGQAGLLLDSSLPASYRELAENDDYFLHLKNEYRFLSKKFSLTPVPHEQWRLLRTRPQNFPYIRISQIVNLFFRDALSMPSITEAGTLNEVRVRLATGVTEYWKTHYTFGCPSPENEKRLQPKSLNLLVLNSVIPLLFAYGRYRGESKYEKRALDLFAQLPAEDNFITRTWAEAGVKAQSAADSQALIHLRRNYCERRDCLRCRFGFEYLTQYHSSENNG